MHALGIVHRDLKPENLILRAARQVKLIDFGIAQIGQQGGGTSLGTAAYMAPEQAAGRPVDGRADVYALGVLLFEMIAGRHPFPSKTDGEYLLRHADETPPRPGKLAPRCPPALETAILRCLEKQPEDRYPDAATVAKVLRAIDPNARDQPRRRRQDRRGHRDRRGRRRRRVLRRDASPGPAESQAAPPRCRCAAGRRRARRAGSAGTVAAAGRRDPDDRRDRRRVDAGGRPGLPARRDRAARHDAVHRAAAALGHADPDPVRAARLRIQAGRGADRSVDGD